MYRRYRLLTRGLLVIKLRKELIDLQDSFGKLLDTNHLKILSTTQVAFEHQVTDLLFNLRPQIINSPTKPIQTVTESKKTGTNYLGFAKSLFQHYCQHLELTVNHLSAESAFNFYIHKKISYLLKVPVKTNSARGNFYNELIQNTSLPTNYNFTAILTEINKEIEIYTQQRYPITYANKGKEKLQTPAVISQRIQPSTWKKTRVKSPINPLYYYISGSAINITSTGAFTSNTTSIFEQFSFQSKQRKEDLLEPYGMYFKGFNPWEVMESEEDQEKEEKESEDQEFTYQNLITENPEIKNLNFQTQQNLNLENLEIETLNFQT
ncbi:hypothetical protein G9A89_013151 [Geosiphon pyriformis]|nr:hypothetical protein G9A89_013151 [Geosiphon pyriformis]